MLDLPEEKLYYNWLIQCRLDFSLVVFKAILSLFIRMFYFEAATWQITSTHGLGTCLHVLK